MKKIPLFILSFVTWMLLVWKFDAQNIFAGVVVGIISALLFSNLGKLEEKEAGIFSLSRAGKFIMYIVYVLGLWIKGALHQIIVSVFCTAEEVKTAELWIKTDIKKPSSRFFLLQALYYAPDFIAIDFKEDSVLVNYSGANGTTATEIVKNLEIKVKEIFE
ncbi:MAG: Na+/H+ antiporter subunit E [Elusimicrobiota bacterium]